MVEEKFLKDGERADRIGFGNLELIQKPEEFCYGVDAVILSHFASVNSSRIPCAGHKTLCFDLGTATGIIPLILSYKTKWAKIIGVEVQKDSFDRAIRTLDLNNEINRLTEDKALEQNNEINRLTEDKAPEQNNEINRLTEDKALEQNNEINRLTEDKAPEQNNIINNLTKETAACSNITDNELNGNILLKLNDKLDAAGKDENYSYNGQVNNILKDLKERIAFINEDVIDFETWGKVYKGNSDVVTSNPPYFEKSGGLKNDNNPKTIARHETTAGLEDFIKAASYLLKSHGDFYMIHRPSRLVDICEYGRKYKLEPKEIQFVSPKPKAEPNIIMVHFVKNGGKQLKILKTLNVHNEDGSYTEELKQCYL